mmetsp:Transcript_10895/g.18283  ORF Transcript_10895/g.18283 Transcript_10895/m.18283 type:complete len:306 (-) Transcript_10895:351-1268(-)
MAVRIRRSPSTFLSRPSKVARNTPVTIPRTEIQVPTLKLSRSNSSNLPLSRQTSEPELGLAGIPLQSSLSGGLDSLSLTPAPRADDANAAPATAVLVPLPVSPKGISSSPILLEVMAALNCILCDAVLDQELTKSLDETHNDLGDTFIVDQAPMYACDLETSRDLICSEIYCILAVLQKRLHLDDAVFVLALIYIEKAVRNSIPFTLRTARPLITSAVAIGYKGFYDESMTLGDLRLALPSMNFARLRQMEIDFLYTIDYKISILEPSQWAAYVQGLRHLSAHFKDEFETFWYTNGVQISKVIAR